MTGRRRADTRAVPDILDCIASLSNDEVFTPPATARRMLALLPAEVWTNPDLKWLDPSTKSGVFLREIARRLMDTLSDAIPDEGKRREHIYKNMLYGLPTTKLTAMMSRRTVYYTKDADHERYAVVRMGTEEGNIPFAEIEHTFSKGSCEHCGAPETLERGESRANYAYPFIHPDNAVFEKWSAMKFDVIVGNPPYQFGDGGHSASASPLYQKFVEAAIDMDPQYVIMITPSRWFSGGKGLDKFRDRMLKREKLKALVDYPKLYDCFPGVKIRGGVSYFLWQRGYEGKCTVQTMWDGKPVGPAVERYLDSYNVLVRRNEAVSILEKVRAYRVDSAPEPTLDAKVSGSKPFGLRTFFHGQQEPVGLSDPIKLYGSQRVSWIERSVVSQNAGWIKSWKVLVSAVQGTSAAVETKFLGKPILSGPEEACTETYVVAGVFDSEEEAQIYAGYLQTRFARFLVSLRKAGQHATRDVYAFIPEVPLDQNWTDEILYARYNLTSDEIAFIESQVKEMP